MKKFYIVLTFLLYSIISNAQGYKFGLIHINNYDFKIIGIPDFDSIGNTDVSDIGFAIMLPAASNADIVNEIGLLTGRTWTVQQFDAAFLTNLGLGDGTKDIFLFNLPPGQSLVAHTAEQEIDLVSFQISNMPLTGEMTFLLNSNPIAMGSGGVLDSFYNSNIDATTTQDYFSGLAIGFESFMFDTLNVEDFNVSIPTLNVYPNPTKDYITVDTQQMIKHLELYNLGGKLIIRNNYKNEVDLSQLSDGIYLLKIILNEGTEVTKRIVKH